MKVPNYIKEAIRKNAKANEIARQTDNTIRDWFSKNNINNDAIIDQFIDSCDMTNDPEGFIRFLEHDADAYEGNSSLYED